MTFRKTDTYKKKVMRLGQALRRWSNISTDENNFNSLSVEVDSLEELSLSAFSLMKAIKKALVENAESKAKSLIVLPGRNESKTCACSFALCNGHRCACKCHDDKNRDEYGCVVYSNSSRIVHPFSRAE